MMFDLQNIPILRFPDDHPAKRLVLLRYLFLKEHGGIELAYKGREHEAYEFEWMCSKYGHMRKMSDFIYAHIHIYCIQDHWFENPPDPTDTETILLPQIHDACLALADWKHAARDEPRALGIAHQAERLLTVWDQSIRRRLTQIGFKPDTPPPPLAYEDVRPDEQETQLLRKGMDTSLIVETEHLTIMDYPDDHPAKRYLIASYYYMRDFACLELAWEGREHEAYDFEWHCEADDQTWQASRYYRYFMGPPEYLGGWVHQPNNPTPEELAALTKFKHAYQALGAWKRAAQDEPRALEMALRAEEVIRIHEQSVRLRLKRANIDPNPFIA